MTRDYTFSSYSINFGNQNNVILYAITYNKIRLILDQVMKSISVTQARANLFKLVDETATTSEPVLITGKRNNAVLVSEEDWRAIQETLYLSQVKGLKESLIEGKNTPIEECIPLEELEW